MKTRILSAILVVAVIVLVFGSTLFVAAAPGEQEDPFITLSYLDNVFRPQIVAEGKSLEEELTTSLDEKVAEFEELLQEAQQGSTSTPDDAVAFSVVTISRGQSLSCSVGAEIMLRVGTATGFGSNTALVNNTTGETLPAGIALTTNHMYTVPIEGNGITATADSVRVLVRGEHIVS